MSFYGTLRRAALVLIFSLAAYPLQLSAVCLTAGSSLAADADTCCDGTHPGAACPMKTKGSNPARPADHDHPSVASCDCCGASLSDAPLPDGSPLVTVQLAPPDILSTRPVVTLTALVEGAQFEIYLPPRS